MSSPDKDKTVLSVYKLASLTCLGSSIVSHHSSALCLNTASGIVIKRDGVVSLSTTSKFDFAATNGIDMSSHVAINA